MIKLLIFFTISIFSCAEKETETKPNVVVILTDDQGWGYLSQSKEKRFTSTHHGFCFDMLRGSTPLLDAGLMRSVTIVQHT